MGLVVEHGGGEILSVADEVLADNHHRQAGGAHVLLGAGVQQAELADVDGLGQNAGRNISHQGNVPGFRKRVPLGAVNGVVQTDVEIIRILVKVEGSSLGM